MSRWIAYRGEITSLATHVTDANSVTARSLAALDSATETNGDGFGLGWYGVHPEPGLFHETRPAWSDENLRHLCHHLHSRLFFAHVRGMGTAPTRQNCHPFANGRWLFMNNGFVGSWNRLRRKVEEMIPDTYYASRRGTTDSEAIFLAMMGAGIDADPIAATLKVLGHLCAMVNADGCNEPLRFTSALTNGVDLFAIRFAENDVANSLYFREGGGEVFVASEPLHRLNGWKQVPAGHALIAKASAAVHILPISIPSHSKQAQELAPRMRVVGRL
jgi:predicted glutamine amidotransferase